MKILGLTGTQDSLQPNDYKMFGADALGNTLINCDLGKLIKLNVADSEIASISGDKVRASYIVLPIIPINFGAL